MDKQKKFYRVDDGDFVSNVNIDFIKEWRVDFENYLHIYMGDGASYEISPYVDDKRYCALLKALQERTVD